MTEKILLLLADGFEEIEALAPADIWRRLGFEVTIAAITGDRAKGSHGITVIADCNFKTVELSSFDAIFLPGGMPGSLNLKENDDVIDAVRKFNAEGKVVSAICAAPMALAKAGILKGKKVTAYPGTEKNFEGTTAYTGNRTETDGNIITAKGAGTAFEFAAEVAQALGRKKETGELFKGMFIKA